MAEGEEYKPDFYVVRKGEGVVEHRMQQERNQERKDASSLSYLQVRDELRKGNISDEDKKKLEERKKGLVQEASQAGHFDDAAYSVNHILQTNTWGRVGVELRQMAPELEQNSHGYEGYKSEWEGIIQDTVEGAASRVQILGIDRKRTSVSEEEFQKWLGRHGYDRERIKRLVAVVREKYLYKILPDEVVDLVGYEVKKQQKISGPSTEEERLREALEKQRKSQEQFVNQTLQAIIAQGGTKGLTAEDIGRAMAMASGEGTPEQQRKIYETVEEGAYAPVDMTLKVPYFLLVGTNEAERERQEKEWKARAAIWSFAANKQKIVSYDKIMENPEAFSITNETLERGLKIRGVFEAAALYSAVISTKRGGIFGNITFMHIPSNDRENPGELKSVFEIKTIAHFEAFRKGMKKLLGNKGIHPSRVEAAEHIAWNLIYACNVVEEFDSKYENGLEKRIPNSCPSHFKNVAMWMVMHPQERLIAKAKATGAIPEAIGQVGEWAVFKRGNIGEVLPTTTIRNALRGVEFQINGRDTNMFEVLAKVGTDLLDGHPPSLSAEDLPWNKIANNPFSGYYLEAVNPATKLFGVIMKGQASGIDGQELGNILKKLEVNKPKIRDNMLKIWHGIRANARGLEYKGGWLDWLYAKNDFIVKHPTFFKVEKKKS